MDGLIRLGENNSNLFMMRKQVTGILEGMEELLQAEASVLALKNSFQLHTIFARLVVRYGVFFGGMRRLELRAMSRFCLRRSCPVSQLIIKMLGIA